MACLFSVCFCELNYTLSEYDSAFVTLQSCRLPSLNCIDRVNQSAKLLQKFEISAKICPVYPPELRNSGIFLVLVLRKVSRAIMRHIRQLQHKPPSAASAAILCDGQILSAIQLTVVSEASTPQISWICTSISPLILFQQLRLKPTLTIARNWYIHIAKTVRSVLLLCPLRLFSVFYCDNHTRYSLIRLPIRFPDHLP